VVQVWLMIACFMLWPSSDLKGKSPPPGEKKSPACVLFIFIFDLLTDVLVRSGAESGIPSG